MDYGSWQEIEKNEVVRKRLAKRLVRECFRDGDFENFHARSAELDDGAVKEIMTDAVNRTHIFLSKLSNAMGDFNRRTAQRARRRSGLGRPGRRAPLWMTVRLALQKGTCRAGSKALQQDTGHVSLWGTVCFFVALP
jgi:hypothetical protein